MDTIGGFRAAGDEAHLLWMLLVAYWQGKPAGEVIQRAKELGSGRMTSRAQQALLHTCLCSPVTLSFPASAKYDTKVLKAAVEAAEGDSEECIDVLAERLCEMVATGIREDCINSCLPGWGHKTYAYLPAAAERLTGDAQQCPLLVQQCLSGHHKPGSAPVDSGRSGLVTLHLSHNMFEGSTGCHEWEAGFLLAETVLNNPELFRGRCCLELGCGSGVVGVILTRVGASAVICTDGDHETVANCRRNLTANGVRVVTETAGSDGCAAGGDRSGGVICQVLQWEGGWGDTTLPDVVLGADLLYDPGVIPSLVSLFCSLCCGSRVIGAGGDVARRHPTVYIATTLRNQSTLERFVEAVRGAGLSITNRTAELQERQGVGFVDVDLLAERERIWVHCIQALDTGRGN